MTEDLLIFGSGSYVGSVFADYIEKRKSYRKVHRVRSKDCDLLDPESSLNFFEKLPEASYKAVFLSVLNKSVDNSFSALIKNLEIVNNFIEGSKKIDLQSLIYFSSVDVYGVPSALPLTEKSLINPDTHYGLAKSTCEMLIKQAFDRKIPTAIFRIPGIFGQAENDRSVIGKIVSAAKNNQVFKLSNGGKVLRDYVWVQDLAKIIEEFLKLKHSGAVNVVTGESYSLEGLVKIISKTLSLDIRNEIIEADLEREFDLVFDNSLLKALLPDFSFSSLEQSVLSYRS